MAKTNIYLKIYFTEPGSKPMKILAVVNRNQLYFIENNFVEVINYNHKVINKFDITKIKLVEDVGEILPPSIRTEEYISPKAEVSEV